MFDHLPTPEGRIGSGRYAYFLKDHLGSIRAVYRDSLGTAKLDQWTDYDPWGLELPALSGGASPNRFKFTGQESLSLIKRIGIVR